MCHGKPSPSNPIKSASDDRKGKRKTEEAPAGSLSVKIRILRQNVNLAKWSLSFSLYGVAEANFTFTNIKPKRAALLQSGEFHRHLLDRLNTDNGVVCEREVDWLPATGH